MSAVPKADAGLGSGLINVSFTIASCGVALGKARPSPSWAGRRAGPADNRGTPDREGLLADEMV
jgi:hypothetical protein